MVGQTLAHYKILEKIGSGGMGDVYLAEDTKLDRKVAFKVLPSELAEDDDRRVRFQREAKAIAALNHPNIVTVHSVEEADGVHFITMELVQGKTLTELIPKKGMELDPFFALAMPLADAVAAAHEAGIVHRDLKPGNVMVTDDGRVKVLDFGLAQHEAPYRVEGNSESPTALKTQEGVLAGTLHYMSPEQVEGKSIDTRSDVFSLGIVYYELLTGRRPFDGDTPASVVSAILKDAPEPVTELAPSLPYDLAKIVRRCLVKERTRRFQNARDVLNELRELQEEIALGPSQSPVRDGGTGFRPPAWASVATLGVGLLVGYIAGQANEATPSGGGFTAPVQITSASGVEGGPTWSPDGGQLAYHSDQDGDFDIWLAQAGGGRPLNLTDEHAGVDQSPAGPPTAGALHSVHHETVGVTSSCPRSAVRSAASARPRLPLDLSRTRSKPGAHPCGRQTEASSRVSSGMRPESLSKSTRSRPVTLGRLCFRRRAASGWT